MAHTKKRDEAELRYCFDCFDWHVEECYQFKALLVGLNAHFYLSEFFISAPLASTRV